MRLDVLNEARAVTPFALKDAPALIERTFPPQKISAEEAARLFVVRRRSIENKKAIWKEEPFEFASFAAIEADRNARLEWRASIDEGERRRWCLRWLDTFSYVERVGMAKRPEEID